MFVSCFTFTVRNYYYCRSYKKYTILDSIFRYKYLKYCHYKYPMVLYESELNVIVCANNEV